MDCTDRIVRSDTQKSLHYHILMDIHTYISEDYNKCYIITYRNMMECPIHYIRVEWKR